MKKIWTPEMEAILVRDYPNRGSYWCSERLGVSSSQAIKRANVLGLKTTDARRKQRQSENIKKMWDNHPGRYSGIDYRVFVDCKTKEAAYVLGLLWADGYMNGGRPNRIAIEIVADDFDAIRGVFDATGSWSVSRRKRKNRRPQACATICNKPLSEFLLSFGYGEKNVRSACGILEKLPIDLRTYWWRGFFDGDGCFYSRRHVRQRETKESYEHVAQMSLAGGLKQDWGFAEKLLTGLGICFAIQRRSHRKRKKSSSSSVRVTNKEGIRKFGEYIYGEYDGVGLRRKYEAWKKCLEIDKD